MSSSHYHDEYDCPFCGRETLHFEYISGHERDSSNDYRKCTVCGAIKFDHAEEYMAPSEADPE